MRNFVDILMDMRNLTTLQQFTETITKRIGCKNIVQKKKYLQMNENILYSKED